MTGFWIYAALLCAIALAFIVLPLLRRSASTDSLDQDSLNLSLFQDQLAELDADLAAGNLDQVRYDAARHDLERGLLNDVEGKASGGAAEATQGKGLALAALLLVAVPAAAVVLYSYYGNSAIIGQLQAATQASAAAPALAGHSGSGEMPPMDELVAKLAKRMEENPNDVKGWMMLGRSYFALQQPQKAAEALARAYALAPENPDVILGYAEALASLNNNSFEGRAGELLSEALAIDPNHSSARWLSGIAAFQRGQYSAAAVTWQKLVAEMDPASDEAKELTEYIAVARSRAGEPPLPVVEAPAQPTETAAPPAPEAPATSSGPSVTVSVSIADALITQIEAGDSLFIYAKAVSGPPMPLAAKRLKAKDLPVTVVLDDSSAMMPQMKISNFEQVTVGARISKSGQAMPMSGDLEGEISPVKPGESPSVSVLIERVRP